MAANRIPFIPEKVQVNRSDVFGLMIIGLFSVAGEKYFGRDQLNLQFPAPSRTGAVSSCKKAPGAKLG